METYIKDTLKARKLYPSTVDEIFPCAVNRMDNDLAEIEQISDRLTGTVKDVRRFAELLQSMRSNWVICEERAYPIARKNKLDEEGCTEYGMRIAEDGTVYCEFIPK